MTPPKPLSHLIAAGLALALTACSWAYPSTHSEKAHRENPHAQETAADPDSAKGAGSEAVDSKDKVTAASAPKAPPPLPESGIIWRRPIGRYEWLRADGDNLLLVDGELGARRVHPLDGVADDAIIERVEGNGNFRYRYRLAGRYALRFSDAYPIHDAYPFITAVDTRTRKVVWRLPRGYRNLPSDPDWVLHAANADTLLLTDADHYHQKTAPPAATLVAVGLADGAERWVRTLNAQSIRGIAIDGERAVMLLPDAVECFSIKTGAPLWRTPTAAVPLTVDVANGRVVYMDQDKNTVVLALSDGRQRLALERQDRYLVGFQVGPDDLVTLQETDRWWWNRVSTFDLETGALRWQKEVEATYRATVHLGIHRDRLVLFTGGPLLRTFDLRSGAEGPAWGFSQIDQIVSATIADREVAIVDTAGYGAKGELIAVAADPWPAATEITVSGCAAVTADRRLCDKAPIWIRLNEIRVLADKKGCFTARLAARGVLTVAVDAEPILAACRTTRRMQADGLFHCETQTPIQLTVSPDQKVYTAAPVLSQAQCPDI